MSEIITIKLVHKLANHDSACRRLIARRNGRRNSIRLGKPGTHCNKTIVRLGMTYMHIESPCRLNAWHDGACSGYVVTNFTPRYSQSETGTTVKVPYFDVMPAVQTIAVDGDAGQPVQVESSGPELWLWASAELRRRGYWW